MTTTKTITPRQAAQQLWLLGANITAIPFGGKQPAHEWNNPNAPWASERQPAEYIDKLNWSEKQRIGPGGRLLLPIETVGIICGINNWRWLDIDACKDADGNKIIVPESVLHTILTTLGLPLDYRWAGRSRSGAGWHIGIRCDGALPDEIAQASSKINTAKGGGAGVKIGIPIDAFAGTFAQIELRWEYCQIMLPKPSGYSEHLPKVAPTEVTIAQVVAAFLSVAKPKPRKLDAPTPAKPAKAARPSASRERIVWDDRVRASIRDHFDLVAWFCQEFSGETQEESGGEVRILGHNGLMVNTDKASWYIHGEGVGGDWADAIAHTRYGGHMPTDREFFDLVRIAADFAGVHLDLVPHTARANFTPLSASSTLAPDDIALLNSLNLTDTGNAEALAALVGENMRYCANRKKWLIWRNNRWEIDEIGYAYRELVKVVRQRYEAAAAIEDLEARKRVALWAINSENNSKLEAALKCASRNEPFATTINYYDTDPMLAATKTATLDLRTGQARPPARPDYLTMSLGADYDPNATAPRWRCFLNEVFDNDAELISYIQRAVGYSLTGDTSEQKLFLCHGDGANGKSTFLEVLTWLMGDYSANTSFDTFDAGRRSDATNDLAALKGRRLVTVIESEEDRRLAEARVKSVTGGDLVTARFLYGEFFSYRPEFKIWMAMNHKPRIKGTDRGIWRRIQLIPFTQNFEGREDRSLRETLRAELPGILNWALDGLRAWHAKGLAQCTTITNATQSYQAESDQVGRWMHEQTIAGRQYMAQASVAYANYVRWCVDNGEVPDSQSMWGRQLTERGFTRERRRGDWQLIGFGLLAPESLTEQPQDGSDSVQASITTPETDTSLCAPPTGLTVEVEPEVEPSVEPDDKDLPSGWSMSHSSKGWWITNGAGIGEYHRSAAEAVEMAWAHEEAAGMVQRC